MQDASLFAPYEQLAQALLPHAMPTQDDGAHDFAHLTRVWRNVQRIQATEGGDLELLAAATLLHDCVAVEKNSPHRSQASHMAAVKAAEVLGNLGWPEHRIAQVTHAIEAHSFSAGIPPRTLEAKVLQDADRLDSLGWIGIARCFYTAGRMGSDLYDPRDHAAKTRPLDDARYALDHFEKKLLTLADQFQTPTGTALARARHDLMARFVQDFTDEVI